jgi:hypothetical protein
MEIIPRDAAERELADHAADDDAEFFVGGDQSISAFWWKKLGHRDGNPGLCDERYHVIQG